jgi:hypothetical protein
MKQRKRYDMTHQTMKSFWGQNWELVGWRAMTEAVRDFRELAWVVALEVFLEQIVYWDGSPLD